MKLFHLLQHHDNNQNKDNCIPFLLFLFFVLFFQPLPLEDEVSAVSFQIETAYLHANLA